MTNRIRFAMTSLFALALLVSCGDGEFDPTDPTLVGARLVIVGSPAVNLRYGAAADLRVRYERMDGSRIDNAPIDYVIVGDDVGSRLGALQTTTDANGEAAVVLTAGSAEAMFAVEVTPPVGDGVSFSVAVSDTDAGSIVVSMTYAGSRTLARFDTYLFTGQTCAMMTPTALPTALRSAPSVTMISAMPAFAGVAVGSAYSVAVVARSATNLAAFGCRDMVSVAARAETPVAITLMDTVIGPDFTGVWDLDNRLDFAGALPPSVDAFLTILDELTDDTDIDGERLTDTDMDGRPEWGQDPGAFIVDILMRQTCHWECMAGEDYSTCSEINHPLGDLRALYMENLMSWDPQAQSRFLGGCGGWTFIHQAVQTAINDLIDRLVPSFVTDWVALGGDLSRAITNAHILSILTISSPAAGMEFQLPMAHELVQMSVIVHDPSSTPPGMEREFTFALADAGFTSLEVTDITTVDGMQLNIPSHQFTLNWGRLALYIYGSVILQEIFGVMNTGELLASYIDCVQVGLDLRAAITANIGSGGPSAVALEGYCNTALTAAGGAIEGALADYLDSDGTLTLQGVADGEGISMETGRVDRLTNGMWTGSWGEAAAAPETISGTFTGTRRAGM